MSRERRSTEFFDTEAASKATSGAKFDFAGGAGAKLSSLSGWVTGNRGAAADSLETALEPLHRAIFGRPGKQMERRAALADYCGYPPAMAAIMKSKVISWKKDQLKALVQALAINTNVSIPQADLAEAVLKFLQSPAQKQKAAAAPPKPKAEKRPAVDDAAEEPPKKKAKTEVASPVASKKPTPTPPSSGKKVTAATLHDDTIRVAVYRRVLAMSPEERNNIGIKAFRAEVEVQYSLPDGSLKDRIDIIRETATACVKAVREAETRGATKALEAAPTEAVDATPVETENEAPPVEEVATETADVVATTEDVAVEADNAAVAEAAE